MYLQDSKHPNKVIIGLLAIVLMLIAFFLVPFHLLETLPEGSRLYRSLEIGLIFAILGMAIGFGLDPNVEVRYGREDVFQGIAYSLIFLAIGFVFNFLFLSSMKITQYIGSEIMSDRDTFLLAYSAGIFEELLFRFGLQRILIRLLPNHPAAWISAIFISSAIFSGFHIFVYGASGYAPFVYLFLLGTVAGLGMLVSKRLSVPFLVHLENNILAFFMG